MVVRRLCGEDVPVPLPTTVWMVHLSRGAVNDVRGELSLEDDAVVFTDSRTGTALRIPFGDLGRARRVRGSPVLMVTGRRDGQEIRIAFYFTQPPPLTSPEAESLPSAGLQARPMGAFGAFRRTSKRRQMRTNISYLANASTNRRAQIEEWAAEIARRLGSGRGKD